jgi:outer membrane immunogenic protein
MRNFLIALVAFFGLSGAALASDLPSKRMAPAPAAIAAAVQAPLFTGFHVGANVGYEANVLVDHTRGLDGSFAGVSAGYDRRFGDLVVGAETDIQTVRKGVDFGADYFGTVRGRVGYAMGNMLPYVTAGYAYAKYPNVDLTSGYAYGAGVEFAVAGPWSVKGEYLRVDFNTPGSRTKNDLGRVGVNYRF